MSVFPYFVPTQRPGNSQNPSPDTTSFVNNPGMSADASVGLLSTVAPPSPTQPMPPAPSVSIQASFTSSPKPVHSHPLFFPYISSHPTTSPSSPSIEHLRDCSSYPWRQPNFWRRPSKAGNLVPKVRPTIGPEVPTMPRAMRAVNGSLSLPSLTFNTEPPTFLRDLTSSPLQPPSPELPSHSFYRTSRVDQQQQHLTPSSNKSGSPMSMCSGADSSSSDDTPLATLQNRHLAAPLISNSVTLELEASLDSATASSLAADATVDSLELKVGSVWPSRGKVILASHREAYEKGYGWRLLWKYGHKASWTLGCSTTQIGALSTATCCARMKIRPVEEGNPSGKWSITSISLKHDHDPEPEETLHKWKDETDLIHEFNTSRSQILSGNRRAKAKGSPTSKVRPNPSSSHLISVDESSDSEATDSEAEEITAGWRPRSQLILDSNRLHSSKGYGWKILSMTGSDNGWTLGCSTTLIEGIANASCPARLDIRPQNENPKARLWRITRDQQQHNHEPEPDEELKDCKTEEEMIKEFKHLAKLQRQGGDTAREWRERKAQKSGSVRRSHSTPSSSTLKFQQAPESSLDTISSSSSPLSVDDLDRIFTSLHPALSDFATPLFNLGINNHNAFKKFVQDPLRVLDEENIGLFVLRRVLAKELGKVREVLGIEYLE